MSRIIISDKTYVMILSFLIFFMAVSVATAGMMRGMWELKGFVKREGSTTTLIPINSTSCITPNAMMPPPSVESKNCTVLSQKTEENGISWITKCEDKNGLMTESTGTITYDDNNVEENIQKVMTNSNGMKTVSTTHISGKRVGDCK
jgi:hypothetical protein